MTNEQISAAEWIRRRNEAEAKSRKRFPSLWRQHDMASWRHENFQTRGFALAKELKEAPQSDDTAKTSPTDDQYLTDDQWARADMVVAVSDLCETLSDEASRLWKQILAKSPELKRIMDMLYDLELWEKVHVELKRQDEDAHWTQEPLPRI